MANHPQQHIFRAKSSSLRAIMNHEGLRGTMTDALHSKPGSTKRRKAQKVLLSLERMHRNKSIKDGKGGWGGILPETGNFLAGFGNSMVNAANTFGGAMDWVNKGTDTAVQTGLGATTGLMEYSAANQPYWWMGQGNYSPLSTTGGMQYAGNQISKILKSPTVTPLATAAANQGAPSITPNMSVEPKTTSTPNMSMLPQTDQSGNPAAGLQTYGPGGTSPGTEGSTTITDTTGLGNISGAYPFLQEAVSKGYGPNYFAYQLMTNKSVWDKEFPGTPFPNGLGVADDIKKDIQAIKDGYHIDKLRDNLTRLGNMGLNIGSDMTSYINAKDTYVKKIDTILDSANEKMLNMDMSNPNNQAQMSSYMSYLTVLKGRQQKRYGDWLTQNMSLYTNNLTAATNNFNAIYSQYQDALKSQEPQWQDISNQKTTMFNMLGDMYKNMEALPDRDMKRQLNNLQITKSALDLYSSMKGAGAGNGKPIADLNSTEVNSLKDLLGINFQPEVNSSGVTTGKKVYNSVPTDYYGAITNAVNSGGFSESAAKALMNQELPQIVNSYISQGDMSGLKNVKTLFSTMKSQYDAETDPRAQSIIAQDIANLSETVGNKMYNGFQSFFDQNHDTIAKIANELVKGWYKPGDAGKRKLLIDQYSKDTGLDKSMVTQIFDVIDNNYNPGQPYFAKGEDPANALIRDLTNGFLTNYGIGYGNYQGYTGLSGGQ